MAAQQAAEHPDGDLKVLDVDILIEGQVVVNEFPGFCRFVVQPHQDHRVEGIYGCHVKRNAVPVAIGLAQRPELIMAPRVLFVTVPGMQELLPHKLRHFCFVAAGSDLLRCHDLSPSRPGGDRQRTCTQQRPAFEPGKSECPQQLASRKGGGSGLGQFRHGSPSAAPNNSRASFQSSRRDVNASRCHLGAPAYLVEAICFVGCYSQSAVSSIAFPWGQVPDGAECLDQRWFYVLPSRLIFSGNLGYHDGNRLSIPPDPTLWCFRRGSAHGRTAQARRANQTGRATVSHLGLAAGMPWGTDDAGGASPKALVSRHFCRLRPQS